jgi:Ca2+-binding RTX toxin-like protein
MLMEKTCDLKPAGDDMVAGGDGRDVLGDDGDNHGICGRRGNDIVSGGTGRDAVFGNAGDDIPLGDAADLPAGGPGDDTYVVGVGDSAVVRCVADTIDDRSRRNTIVLTGGATIIGVQASDGGHVIREPQHLRDAAYQANYLARGAA